MSGECEHCAYTCANCVYKYTVMHGCIFIQFDFDYTAYTSVRGHRHETTCVGSRQVCLSLCDLFAYIYLRIAIWVEEAEQCFLQLLREWFKLVSSSIVNKWNEEWPTVNWNTRVEKVMRRIEFTTSNSQWSQSMRYRCVILYQTQLMVVCAWLHGKWKIYYRIKLDICFFFVVAIIYMNDKVIFLLLSAIISQSKYCIFNLTEYVGANHSQLNAYCASCHCYWSNNQ